MGTRQLAAGFEIGVSIQPSNGLHLEFPGATNYYHWIQCASALDGAWNTVAILVGTNGTQTWTNPASHFASNNASFFRVVRISTSNPLDADHDGIDDLYEMKYSFLNPLDASDAQRDQDGDGLSNYGEYLAGTNPTDSDTDKDFVNDGYEVQMGTNPKDPADAPALEFRINNDALYTSNATVTLDFTRFVAEQVAISESFDMTNAQVFAFSQTLPYTFVNATNGWRLLYLQYRRNGGTNASRVVSRGIHLDTVPPALTIDAPVNGSTTTVPLVHIEGSVSDDTPVKVTINGLRADGIITNRYFREDHVLAPGTNQIVVVATDATGNGTSHTNWCILDTSSDVTPPAFSLDLPLDYEVSGGVTNWFDQTTLGEDDALSFHGLTDERGVTTSFTITGSGGTNSPHKGTVLGTNVYARVSLFPGTNILSWTVSDSAGNKVQSSRTIFRDTNFLFRITSPSAMTYESSNAVTVTGIASLAFSNATITVNGVNAVLTNSGNIVTFATSSSVSITGDLTPLIAVAFLNGQTYYTESQLTGYELTFSHQEIQKVESGFHFFEGYTTTPPFAHYDYSYDDLWTYNFNWDSTKATDFLYQSSSNNLTTITYHTSAGITTESHILEGIISGTDTSYLNSLTLGFLDFGWQWDSYGVQSWEHTYNAGAGYLTFQKIDADLKRENQTVILQFDALDYDTLLSTTLVSDPAAVTFWNQPGFWYNGEVAFVVTMETFKKYTISESDFTWPSSDEARIQILPPLNRLGRFQEHTLSISGLHTEQIKVDIVGHQPGTMAAPGAEVSENDEDDPKNLIIFDNSDYDDGDSVKDKDHATIGPQDDDIVKVTLKWPFPPLHSGSLHLTVTPANTIKVFKASGAELLNDYSVDLAAPTGDLADLAAGEINLYVEAIKPSLDVCLKLTYKDGTGRKICSDELHLFSSLELTLRTKILEAAAAQSLSFIKFVADTGPLTTCDLANAFWDQALDGITPKTGVSPADAIDNLFVVQPNFREFTCDCGGALVMVWYKAVLEAFQEYNPGNGRAIFDGNFQGIRIKGIYSTTPPTDGDLNGDFKHYAEYHEADWRVVWNPDVDSDRFPQWGAENTIQLTKDSGRDAWFYSHPFGTTSLAFIESDLDSKRKPSPLANAFLKDGAHRLDAIRLTEFMLTP